MAMFRLLDLPRELRNEVFRQLFQTPSSCFRFGTNIGRTPPHIHWFCLGKPEAESLRAYLNLSTTSRQLQDEAAQIFFEVNVFKAFAASGIQELPDAFVRRLQKLELYGFRERPHANFSTSNCESKLDIKKERGRFAVRAGSDCLQDCKARGTGCTWDYAAAELEVATNKAGVLTCKALDDLLTNLGRVSYPVP